MAKTRENPLTGKTSKVKKKTKKKTRAPRIRPVDDLGHDEFLLDFGGLNYDDPDAAGFICGHESFDRD